jgi:hypothetical protein
LIDPRNHTPSAAKDRVVEEEERNGDCAPLFIHKSGICLFLHGIFMDATWRGACASKATDKATIRYAKNCRVSPLSMKERRPKRSIIQKHMPDEIMYEVALQPVKIRARSSVCPILFVRIVGK